MAKVTIITVNYNGAEDTIAMLSSLESVSWGCELDVIVVDNGSKEDETPIIAKAHSWVRTLRSDVNLGFAGGNNLAVEHAEGDYILYLNNDTMAEGDFITPMVNFMEQNPSCGLCSPKILYSDDRKIHYGGFALSSLRLRRIVPLHYRGSEDEASVISPTPFAHGAAMMTSRKVMKQVGLMREDYFLYCEEMDYSIRVLKAGFQVWYLPFSTVLHKGSATIGGANPSSIYYSSRNYLYLISDNTTGFRHVALLADKLLLASSKILLKYLLKGDTALAGAYLRGLLDFIRNRRGIK